MANNFFGFVDGDYVRRLQISENAQFFNPRQLLEAVWSNLTGVLFKSGKNSRVVRVIYYDAIHGDEEQVPKDRERYWEEVERLDDVQLGFGFLREQGRKKPPKQKAVDTLLATHMVVHACRNNYEVGVLVSGDADFIPVVQEVQRCGKTVAVVAEPRSASDDLVRSADRFIKIVADDVQHSPNTVKLTKMRYLLT